MQQPRIRAALALSAALLAASWCGARIAQAKSSTDDTDAGWIGLGVRDLDADTRDTLALASGTRGVVVTRVLDAGPAASAGVQPGDVITHVGSRPVRSSRDFVRVVQRHAPGDRIDVRLQREGKEKRLQVTLRAHPEREAFARTLPHVPERFVLGDGVQFGVEGVDLEDGDLAAYFGVEPGAGVLVTDVVPESGAAEAGIRGGDVLLAVAGKPVSSMSALRESLRAHSPGDSVEVRLRRQQREQNVQVTLQEGARELSALLRSPAPGLHFFTDRDDLRRELDDLRRELDALRDEMRRER